MSSLLLYVESQKLQMNLSSGPTIVADFLSLLVIIIRGKGILVPKYRTVMVPAYGYANTIYSGVYVADMQLKDYLGTHADTIS